MDWLPPGRMTFPAWALFSVLKLAVDFFGPDTSEWKKCGDFKLSGCLWAAADLPGPGKALKGVKIWKKARKAEKKTDDAVDAAEKAVEKCHSFTEETQVELADGGHSDIKDVKVGDKVLATDPETGRAKLARSLRRSSPTMTRTSPTSQ